MVAVEVVDAQGRIVSFADNEIMIAVSGGRLIGVGNGDPSSHEADKAGKRRAFNGLCMAIVQAPLTTGDMKIEAASPGLDGASVHVPAVAGPPRPRVG